MACLAVLCIVTFFTRSFFLTIGYRLKLSPTIRSLIQYAPMGAFIAIVIPEIFFIKDPSSGLYHYVFHPNHILGSLVTITIHYFSNSIVLSIGFGLITMAIAKQFF